MRGLSLRYSTILYHGEMVELNHVYVRSTVVNIGGLASDGELDLL